MFYLPGYGQQTVGWDSRPQDHAHDLSKLKNPIEQLKFRVVDLGADEMRTLREVNTGHDQMVVDGWPLMVEDGHLSPTHCDK